MQYVALYIICYNLDRFIKKCVMIEKQNSFYTCKKNFNLFKNVCITSLGGVDGIIYISLSYSKFIKYYIFRIQNQPIHGMVFLMLPLNQHYVFRRICLCIIHFRIFLVLKIAYT